MRLVPIFFAALFSGFSLFSAASAQTPAPEPLKSDAAQLEALAKKIDEQNAKIDALSQQILKLQQSIASQRPGVMIGEGAPSTSTAAASTSTVAAAESASNAGNGNTHVVARGETLTSIARMHNVSVSEL